MGKKEFTIEEKIEAIELHIHDGMGYGADRKSTRLNSSHWS